MLWSTSLAGVGGSSCSSGSSSPAPPSRRWSATSSLAPTSGASRRRAAASWWSASSSPPPAPCRWTSTAAATSCSTPTSGRSAGSHDRPGVRHGHPDPSSAPARCAPVPTSTSTSTSSRAWTRTRRRHAEPGTVLIRIPIHILDTIFGAGYETITVPVQGGVAHLGPPPAPAADAPVTLSHPHPRQHDRQHRRRSSVITIDIAAAGRPRAPRTTARTRSASRSTASATAGTTTPPIEELIRAELAGTDIGREVEFDYAGSVLRAVAAMGGGGQPPTVAWSGMTLVARPRRPSRCASRSTFDGATGSSFPDEWRRFLTRQFDDFRDRPRLGGRAHPRPRSTRAATAGAQGQIADDVGATSTSPATGPTSSGARTSRASARRSPARSSTPAAASGSTSTSTSPSRSRPCCGWPQGGATPDRSRSTPSPSHDATHAGEQACCAVTGDGLFFPILGWKYLAEGKIGWGGLALGMFVPVHRQLHHHVASCSTPTPELPLAPASAARRATTRSARTRSRSTRRLDPCEPAVVHHHHRPAARPEQRPRPRRRRCSSGSRRRRRSSSRRRPRSTGRALGPPATGRSASGRRSASSRSPRSTAATRW